MFKHFLHHKKSASLLFKDKHGKVVAAHHLSHKLVGQRIDRNQIVHKYMPKGYRFADNHQLKSIVIRSGASEVIYVEKDVPQKANPQPKIGEIVIQYKLGNDQGRIIRQRITRQPIGQRFIPDKYIKNVPAGYQFKQVINGGHSVSKFIAARQHFDIAIAKKKPVRHNQQLKQHSVAQASHKQSSDKITEGILYQNVDDGNIERTARISGPRGMKINYTPYIQSGSKHMPKGFHFYHLATGTIHTLQPHTSYTILIKKNSVKQHPKDTNSFQSTASVNSSRPAIHTPREIYGNLIYQDVKTSRVIKSIPIHGRHGTPVDYGKYMVADQLPKQYHLTGLGAQTSKLFQPNAHYVILVARDHMINSHPRHKPVVNGNVDYCDIKTHQVIDVQQINGPVGLNLDYKRYIPKNYRFLKLSQGTTHQLTPNMHAIVWITRKASSDTNNNSQRNAKSNLIQKTGNIAQHHNTNQHQLSQNISYETFHNYSSSRNIHDNPHALPQDPNKAVNIGKILENLGKSLSTLGQAIGRHQI